jgi:hypothetical protein
MTSRPAITVALAVLAGCGARVRADDWWTAAQACPGGQLVREPVGATGTNIYCEVDGERTGRRTALLPDGTRGDGRYVHGKRDGAWEVRYPNGKPKVRGAYRDDEMVGEWIRYWSNGTPGIRGVYEHGRRTGAWTFWTSNGTFERVDHYEDGKRVDQSVEIDSGTSGSNR